MLVAKKIRIGGKNNKILQIIISLALILVLFSLLDIEEISQAISNADYAYLLAAFVVVTLNRIIMSYKWSLLLQVKKIKVPLVQVIKIYYMANFIGLFLPPTVGTDVVRAHQLKTDQHSYIDIISSIVIERFIGFFVLILSALSGLYIVTILFSVSETITEISKVLIVVAVLFMLVLFLSFSGKFNIKLIEFLSRYGGNKTFNSCFQKFVQLSNSYSGYKQHKTTLLLFFILTMLEILTCVLRSYVVATGMGITVPFIYFYAFVPIILTLIRLPISFNGFGINEGGFVFFLSLAGVSKSFGFGVGILDHFIVIISILPGALFYMLNANDVRKTIEKPPLK